MRRMAPIDIFALALVVGCGDAAPGRGIGDEPPATVTTGAGGALEQAAHLLAAGEAATAAAARVRGAASDPATMEFAAIVAADHAELERRVRGEVDTLRAGGLEVAALPAVTDAGYLRWQAELDSLLLVRLVEEPATGLGDGALREALRQAVPTIAAHRQRALQLADSLSRAPADSAGAGRDGG